MKTRKQSLDLVKMENWNIHFINSIEPFSSYIEKLRKAVSNVQYRVSDLIPDIKLDIAFETGSVKIIPEIGFTGLTSGPGLIRIIIDPNNDNFERHLEEPLERMIAHELHHVLRWETVGYGNTLLEALVSEGLAGRFSQEIYGNAPEIWESAIPKKKFIELLN